MRAISNLQNADYKLGIIRYQSSYESYFREMYREKEFSSEVLAEFTYRVVMSKNHPLAQKESIVTEDLTPYTELSHPDPYVPSMPLSLVRKNEILDNTDKHIYIFERGSQMELLSTVPGTFMWCSPEPASVLEQHGLVQRTCSDNAVKYRDVLIYKKEYSLTDLDKAFIDIILTLKKEFKE